MPDRSAIPSASAPDPQWRAQELLLLSQVVGAVGKSLAPERVLREMLHLMSELLGLNRGRIVLIDDLDLTEALPRGRADADFASASIRYAYGLTRDEAARGRFAPGEGVTGRVLATGQPALVQDVDAEPAFLFRTVPRARLPAETVAFIALPIAVGPRTIGVLACHRIRSRHRQLADDVALLKILATLAGQLLQLQQHVAARTRTLEARNAQLTAALESAAARIGLTAGECGISYHLPRLVGASRAFELMLTGRPLPADEAERWGLVSAVVDDDALLPYALELAALVTRNSPYATKHTKQLMWANLDAASLDAALETENHAQILAVLTEDFKEAQRAFAEKRAPAFTGR